MERVKKLGEIKRRILVFPAPFPGHMTPMIHIANILYNKGFSITIIQTTYNTLNQTSFPHFTFYLLNDILNEAFSEYSHPDPFNVKTYCKEPFKECLSQIMNDRDECRVACLIVDPVLMFAGGIADSFNVPKIAFRTGGMSSYVVYNSLSYLLGKGYFPLDETKLDDPLLEFPPLRVKDLPTELFHELLITVMKDINTYQGMICNTFEEIEDASICTFRETVPYPIFPIGPIHKHLTSQTYRVATRQEDQTCIAWLNTQAPKSVLYVSFGSGVKLTQLKFLEVAWGLANSSQPFLWVVRSGLVQKESDENQVLPEGYMDVVKDRGHIVEWAPQLEVLAHFAVGGFWTHCGWNSIIESIYEGVPMICLPFYGDQQINARYVSEKWKIGLIMEKGVKRDEIEKAIRKLMVEEEGQEMRYRAAKFKEEAHLCLLEGHSSCKALDSLTTYILAL